jgi:predicted peptidase
VAVVGSAWLLFNASAFTLLQSLDRPFGDVISANALRRFDPMRLVLLDQTGEEQRSIRYRLMAPARPEPGRVYPLVLFLHGAGERGQDNRQQLQGLPEQMSGQLWKSRFPCYFLAPQCPEGTSWGQQMTELESMLQHVVETHPIDKRRIYLTGLSMGGFGSWELATRRPDLFAAVVPICGGGDLTQAERLVSVPIWAVHGDADEVVPVEQSRRMIEEIRKEGGSPHYTELAGVGHDSWTMTYADPEGVVPWMFRQRSNHVGEGEADRSR